MKLSYTKKGCNYKICDINLKGAATERLSALGLTRGTEIKVLARNLSGAMIISVRGTRLALGRTLCNAIYAEDAWV